MASGCWFVRKHPFVDIQLETSSKSLRYIDKPPSLLAPSVLLLMPLLLYLNLFDWESQQHYVLLHKQINSVQRNSFFNSPGSRLSCFLCLVQKERRKKEVRGKLWNRLKCHPYSLQFAKSSTLFWLLVGYNHTSHAQIMLNRANLYPSPALQIFKLRNTCQQMYETALASSILHISGWKIQQLLVFCVQFLTWLAPHHTVNYITQAFKFFVVDGSVCFFITAIIFCCFPISIHNVATKGTVC